MVLLKKYVHMEKFACVWIVPNCKNWKVTETDKYFLEHIYTNKSNCQCLM